MDTRQKKRSTTRPTGSQVRKNTSRNMTTAPVPTRRRSPRSTAAAAAPVRKRAPRKVVSTRKRTQTSSRPTPDVVYTPATPFNRNRFLLHLTTVVAVVMALVFGISIFFKVEVVTVSGAEKYDAWTVKEASGIEQGDNLLTFGKAKACGKITAALPYVESVRIGIKLPDTVNIEIKELDVAYSIKDSSNNWWLMTSEGRVVDKVDNATAGEYTKILGVVLADPVSGQPAVAYEDAQIGASEETTAYLPESVVRGSDRLAAALDILQYLEERGIIGEAASIDVSDLGNMELWYGQQYQVKLGDTMNLAYKIECMDAAINGDNGLKEYDSGVLDITFTIKENQVIYDSFE